MPYCSVCGDWVDAGTSSCQNCGGDVEDTGDAEREGSGRDASQQQTAGSQKNLLQNYKGGIGFAYEYPVRDGWGPFWWTWALIIGSVFVLPLLLLFGYVYRLSRAAALARADPPKYEDWRGLLTDGLPVLVFGVVLFGGPVIVLFVLGAALSSISGAVGATLIALGAGYVLPAFWVAFVGSDDVVSAFTDGRALSLLSSWYYAKAVLVMLVVGVVIVTVANLLSLIPGIEGPLVGLLLVPVEIYGILGASAYWGYVYDQANVRGIVPPPVEDEASVPEPAPRGGSQPSG